MEFSRRGPATGGAGDGHRFPDPPAHGEREPMLAMRDALLSQLHMACLRQEIIEAEMAKIERDMALCATTGGPQTQTMPMPWHGVATADAGQPQPCLFSTKQPMAQENAKLDGHKLPDSNKDAVLSQLHMARHRQEIIEAELSNIEHAMALCAATGGYQTLTTTMPWHGMVTTDVGWSKAGPFSAEQPVAQQNAEFDDRKLPDSNKAVPPSKASPAEKWELTGITIPVKKPKSPMKWDCTVCQVQATSEQNLQQHYVGQKHLSNVTTLDPRTEASDQKLKTTAEPSLRREEKKTSSIEWSCSTCQASGTSHSTLDSHLKGRRHQQNIAATSTEGDKNGMPKNVTTQEAKSHSMATADAGRSKAGPFRTEQPVAQQNAEINDGKLPDSDKAIPPSKASPAEKAELAGVTIPVKKVKTAAESCLATDQKKTSSIEWNCRTCQAKGTCQATLESHLKGKRHQQNIVAATSLEGDKNGIPKNIVAQVAESHSNVPKHSEKPPSAWSCNICEVICTCQTDLKNHLRGIRHREKVQSLLEQSKNKATDSESQKSKLNPDSSWMCGICHAFFTCESDAEKHLAGHQLNTPVLREKIKQEDNNPPQLAKNKESTSEWNCAMCEAKCKSISQFEAHCGSSRHQQKIQAILGKGNIAKGSSSRTKSEVPSDGSNSKNASLEKAVKQPMLYFCEVCSLLCESSTMLVHHRFGKKHRAKLTARSELS